MGNHDWGLSIWWIKYYWQNLLHEITEMHLVERFEYVCHC